MSNDNKSKSELRALIRTQFWPRLQKCLSKDQIASANQDSKSLSGSKIVIYLPPSQQTPQLPAYYQDSNIDFYELPDYTEYTDDLVFELSRTPGILSLEFTDKPVPYVVPGGRFNEFYGWDSYFIALGLIQDDKLDLASDIASQFAFEIRNYGKILNANRPYYLGRTQPPFLTDLAWRLQQHFPLNFKDWINAAIQEYKNVWTSYPRFDDFTTLSRYHAQGRGIPPEVESGHFDKMILPYAEKYDISIHDFIEKYNRQEIEEPELDVYLLHDRSFRESGHDVTSRFVNCCADLATIDLASLLYKYEMDIYKAVKQFPEDFPNEDAQWWLNKAEQRKVAVDKYLWTKDGYFDYNLKLGSSHNEIVSATSLWPLWSGLASKEQAKFIVGNTLPKLEGYGGVSSTAKPSHDVDCLRQWDYPAGWAPHQILAWQGLTNYGYTNDAQRLALKWLNTITKSFVKTGSVFEKYDIRDVEDPHTVLAEYGNQGDSNTGFGWSNASFVIAYDVYFNAHK